jgi:chloramphenicol-sensitive protein RarD
MNKGLIYGLSAYLMWGLFPIYWKQLSNVPAEQILAHRMTWSLIFLLGLLAMRRNWAWIIPALRDKQTVLNYFAAATLLSINWGVYIWAVNSNFIVETSLGYFINPLVNVLLGYLFFGERLRQWQLAAIVLAAIGVTYLTYVYGRLPYIALTLAFSFGTYGLLKKRGKLNAIESLSFETALLFPFALSFLIYLQIIGVGSFGNGTVRETILLASTGIGTAVPLLCFAAGARRIPLTTMGILQYVAPTIQFLIGVFLYQESFSHAQLIGFLFIWSALGVYSAESLLHYRATHRVQVAG